MLDAEQLRGLVSVWKDRSWLSRFSFGCSDSVLNFAIDAFRSDYNRWFPDDSTIDIRKLIRTPQLIAMLLYRISHTLHFPPPLGRLDERALGTGMWNSEEEPDAKDEFFLLGRDIGQIEIYYSATIGSAFKINHGVGTVIGARCRIGDNCTIHQNVTIGDRKGGRPKIGNNCMIYAGSMILGDIEIGDNCVIAANAVVIDSCPPNSLLIGTPAEVRKLK